MSKRVRFIIFIVIAFLIVLITNLVSNKNEIVLKYNLYDFMSEDIAMDPPLWKITSNNNSIYMMGSIHFATSNTYPVPDYIIDIYKRSDIIAVEYDFSHLSEQETTKYYDSLTSDVSIYDVFSEMGYKKVSDYLSGFSLDDNSIKSLSPNFIQLFVTSDLLTKTENYLPYGIDDYFISLAYQDKKEICNIESIDVQINAATAASDELIEYMTLDIIDNPERYVAELAELYTTWKKGDEQKIYNLCTDYSGIPEELLNDYNSYINTVYLNRNINMTDMVEQYLSNGDNVFFIVGTAHFGGESGIINMLQQKGYLIEKIGNNAKL